MKSENLFTRVVAWLLCAMLVIGYLPVAPIAVNATENDWESDLDVVETTAPETEPPAGSTAETAIMLNELENYISIGAGETVYYRGYFSGMNMMVSGNEGFVVNYNGTDYSNGSWGSIDPITVNSGNPRMPVIFSITNNAAEEAGYCVTFSYPEGNINNPATLWENETASHTFEAGEGAYYYGYTGYSDGYLTFVIKADCDWQYRIDNLTAGVYDDIHFSDDEPVVDSQTFKYIAGEEYVLEVVPYNPEAPYGANPAGTIDVEVIFVAGFGTEESPYALYSNENDVTVAGDEAVYYQGHFSGMDMTVTGSGDFSVIYNGETIAAVDGVVAMPVTSENPRVPVIFAIVGAGDYSVNFTYPAGHMENPAVAELGNNACSVAAGTQGYNWIYTAKRDGELAITVSSSDNNWFYVVNNLTSFVYGDGQWSNSDPVVNPTIINVAAGDEIQITVNSYDPENRWNAPAADLNVNIAYNDSVLPSGDATLKFKAATLKLEADMTVTFQVMGDVFAEGAYTNPRVEYSIPDVLKGTVRTQVVTEYTTNSQGRLQFPFSGISPRMMKAPITATVYGTYEGVEYSYSMEYKLSDYCYNQMNKTANHTNTKFMTLLANLLNFGTAHQQYAGHDVENLINAEMTEFHKGFVSTYAQELESAQNLAYKVIENPAAAFKSAGLVLSNAVVVQLGVECVDTTNASLKIVVDGETYEIPASEWVALEDPTKPNRYTVDFSELMAKQMSSVIYATVCRDGVEISNTITYSIETYAAKYINNAKLGNLLTMMMYYGDAAAAYFNK